MTDIFFSTNTRLRGLKSLGFFLVVAIIISRFLSIEDAEIQIGKLNHIFPFMGNGFALFLIILIIGSVLRDVIDVYINATTGYKFDEYKMEYVEPNKLSDPPFTIYYKDIKKIEKKEFSAGEHHYCIYFWKKKKYQSFEQDYLLSKALAHLEVVCSAKLKRVK